MSSNALVDKDASSTQEAALIWLYELLAKQKSFMQTCATKGR